MVEMWMTELTYDAKRRQVTRNINALIMLTISVSVLIDVHFIYIDLTLFSNVIFQLHDV